MWVVGTREQAVMSFATYPEMMTYCYANGWTEPETVTE